MAVAESGEGQGKSRRNVYEDLTDKACPVDSSKWWGYDLEQCINENLQKTLLCCEFYFILG